MLFRSKAKKAETRAAAAEARDKGLQSTRPHHKSRAAAVVQRKCKIGRNSLNSKSNRAVCCLNFQDLGLVPIPSIPFLFDGPLILFLFAPPCSPPSNLRARSCPTLVVTALANSAHVTVQHCVVSVQGPAALCHAVCLSGRLQSPRRCDNCQHPLYSFIRVCTTPDASIRTQCYHPQPAMVRSHRHAILV